MKWSVVGFATAAMVVALNGTAGAQTTAQYAVSRVGDVAVLTVQYGDLRFEEALTPTTYAFTVDVKGDVVQMQGDSSGDVVVTRGGTAQKINMRLAIGDDMQRVRTLLAGATPLHALAGMVEHARVTESRYAPILQNAYSLLRLVQGYGGASADLVKQLETRPRFGFSTAAQRSRMGPDECWDGWLRSVTRYRNELEQCMGEARDRWWEIWRPAACAWEYDAKALAAAYWFISCNGIG